jgi:hypothetical protein
MISKLCITTLLLFATSINVNANQGESPLIAIDNISGNYIIFLSEKSALDINYNNQGVDRRNIVKKITEQQVALIKALKVIDSNMIISSQTKLLENSIHLQVSHHGANLIQKNTNVIKIQEIPYNQRLNFNTAHQEKSLYRDHKEVTIAIVGNGVDYTHEQLGGSGQKLKYQQAKEIKEINWNSLKNTTVVGGMNFYSLEKNLQDINNNPIESNNNLNVNEGFYPSGTVQASMILEQAPYAKILAFKTIDWSWQQLYPALELVIDPNQDGILNDSPDIMLVNFYGNNSFEHKKINKLVSNHIDKISNLNIAIITSNNQTGSLLSNTSSYKAAISCNSIFQCLDTSKGIKGAVVGSGNKTKEVNFINGYLGAYVTGLIAQLKHDSPGITIKELKELLGSVSLVNNKTSEIAMLPND